jgi:FkbM family methyltransferase
LDHALIFDVGMHRGEDTEYYLKKGYRVIGFEADPDLVHACSQKFAAEIQSGHLIIVEGAIAPPEHGEHLPFYTSSLSVWGTIVTDWVKRNEGMGASSRSITVSRVDIKSAFQRFGVPHFIKIDLEGMDRHVLDVVGELPVKPRYLSLESEKVSFDKLIDEMNALRRAGYSSFKVVPQHDIPGKTLKTLDAKGAIIEHQFVDHSSGPFGDDIAQRWLSYDRAIERYKAVFRDYKRFGDPVISELKKMRGPSIMGDAGWYDTHAKLDEENEDKKIVSVITTCKNRLEHLQQSLASLAGQPDIDIIVVDYGCEQQSGNWVQEHYPAMRIVSVQGDPVFSLSRARNIGALYARSDILFFIDADTILDFDIAEWIASYVEENEFYTVSIKDDAALSGILIVDRADFLKAGGYDEIFRGWGWEDTDLIARLKGIGLKHMSISSDYLSSIPHDNAMRHFSVKDGGSSSKERAMLAGYLFTRIKADIRNQDIDAISFEDKANIMRNIRQTVETFYNSDQEYASFYLDLNLKSPFLSSIRFLYHLKKFLLD